MFRFRNFFLSDLLWCSQGRWWFPFLGKGRGRGGGVADSREGSKSIREPAIWEALTRSVFVARSRVGAGTPPSPRCEV